LQSILNKRMEKYVIILFILYFFTSCSDLKEKNDNSDEFLFKAINKIETQPGDYVLAPSKANFDTAKINGIENTLFVFYPRRVIEQTDSSVILDEYGDTSNLPFAFVIPMEREKKTIAGDILLTWWQNGTGMQRAIVLSKDSTTTPVVYYLDNQYSLYAPATDIKYWMDTLMPNTFLVLSKSVMLGKAITPKNEEFSNFYLILSVTGNKILGLSWSGNIQILDKDKCDIIPFKKEIDVGDSIKIPYIGMYSRGRVISKWEDIGKIKARIFFIDTIIETYANIADAIKIE